jgi:glycosyltransferase involved in cell wall biosynthesis
VTTVRPGAAFASLAVRLLGAARAVAVPIAVVWLDRAARRAEARGRHRTRNLGPIPATTGRRVRFLVTSAWGVGGTVRATITTGAHLASNHDVEVVSVLRIAVNPGMAIPDGLRLRALFDKTDRRPTPRNLAGLLLYRTPSRLWDERDSNYKRASLWTDVLLLRWLRSLPDGTVVIATRPSLVFLASRLAPAGVVVVAQEHQQLGRYREDKRLDLAAALANVSMVVTLTESDREAYLHMLGGSGPQVFAIPNAVPDVPLGPGDPAAHTLIAAGRLAPQKGFDMLLEAFAAVAGKHSDWNLDIFGKGFLRESLEQQVADLGLDGRARLNGPTDRLGEHMRGASVYVLSSRFEGFPIVLLEALAAGLAVVSFDCPTGPSEILTDGTSGLLVPADDVPALAAALDRVMADESLRRRLAAAAPSAVLPYSTRQVGRQWDELLRER